MLNEQRIKKSKLTLKIIRSSFMVIFMAVIFFSAGYFFGFKGFQVSDRRYPEVTITRETPPEKNLDFSLFWRVWDTLDLSYFDSSKLIKSEMVYGAIRGMVSAIGDPYTVFLAPSENKVVQEDLQGTFEGIGIHIGFKGTRLAVMAPLPDSPAEKAGLKAGDLIVGIRDEKRNIDRGTVGITLPDAVRAIRGPSGSVVTLSLLRDGSDEPLVVDVVRSAIDVPSIVLEFVGEEKNIAHIKLLKFSNETFSEWEKIVIEILTKPEIDGIILDVRNNPGGFLNRSVDLASEFLDTNDVVVIEESKNGKQKEFLVERLGRFRNLEVVMLINGGSASASEILAGALRDNIDTILVGETSFGKGTIQESQQVDGGAGLHVTIARWLTPDGFWVNEGGLVPDVEIENNPDTEEDEQLLEAIRQLSV